MPIAVGQTVTGVITTGATLTLPSWTPGPNELVLVSVALRITTITPTIAGNGLTWVTVHDIISAQTQSRLLVFRAMIPTAPTTGSIVITITANTNPVGAIATRFIGADPSGANGAGAIEGTPTETAGPAVDDNDMLFAVTTVTSGAWAWGAGTYRVGTFTVPSGQTIIHDDLITGGVGGAEANSSTWYVGPVVTPGATTVGALNDLDAARDWCMIACSIKPAPRPYRSRMPAILAH